MYAEMNCPALVCSALATACGVVALGQPQARADVTAGRVIDRTYACAVVPRGGARLLNARAHAGTRLAGAWAKLPYAAIRTGVFSGATGNILAWVTSGTPSATTTIDQEFETFDVKTYGTVGVRVDGCRSSRAVVALTAAGLTGGAAAPLGNEYDCAAPRQVVVRLRAVFGSTGSLHRGQDLLTSHAPAREAELAVRTPAGKPLSYAHVRESGQARLFTAKGCRAT
jgi:hypothetical protein